MSLFLIVTGTYIYKHFIRVQNIFDQMYYSRIRTCYSWWGFGNKTTSFGKMPQIERISRDDESFYTEMGVFPNSYEGKYLREGESLVIDCDRNEKSMAIIAVKRFNKFKIIYRYTYDIKTKQLSEAVECLYGELYSGKFNEYREEFRECTEKPQEILLIIEEEGLKQADLLEYKKYFLYDKLLTDWLDANISRFSANRWGRVEYTEVLPLESSK